MPEEQTVAEPQQVEEVPAQQAEQPKKTRDHIAELQRTKDREVAEANRRARDDAARAAEAEAKLADLQALYADAREKANFSDDDEAWTKQKTETERKLQIQAEATNRAAKSALAERLSLAYGISVEELEAYETPEGMKMAAIEYENANLRSQLSPRNEEKPNAEATPEEEAPARTDFDLGTGTGTSKSFKDMSKEEFAAWEKAQASQARQRAMRRA